MIEVKIKKIHPNSRLPEYKTAFSSGADLYACLDTEATLKCGEILAVTTGFCMEIPAGYEAQIRPRSSLGSNGISVPNAPGTIDADYRGEVKVLLINLGQKPFVIQNGDRIAQMVIAPVAQACFAEARELTQTVRGEGGFGSTGTR